MRAMNFVALTLIAGFSFNSFAGDDKNLCDQLIAQGASKSDVEICFKEFGKSKYRKRLEKEARERGENIAASQRDFERAQAEEREEREKYIIKRFEGEELKYLSYAYFVHSRYTDQQMGSDETVKDGYTSPKELCEYLGYEDAVSKKENIGFTLSERIDDFDNPNYSGIYINWRGKKKEVKWDDKEPSSVKHYTKIVCKRERQSDEEIQSRELQDAIRLISEVQESSGSNSDLAQDDSSRDELPLRVRLLLEDAPKKRRDTSRFIHK